MNSSSTDVRAALVAKGYGTGRGVRDTWKKTGAKPAAPAPARPDPKAAMYAKGRLKSGQMNGTEEAYHQHLAERLHVGEIAWFKFEGMTFKLADDTRYTPDFAVMLADGQMEIHEVKGFWTDDARVKIKVAAALFPFEFIAIKKKAKKDGGGWETEVF
ncbi:MAG: DUF1064 domain-containing protein [Comamonas sp.]